MLNSLPGTVPLPGDGKIVRPVDSGAGCCRYSSTIGAVHWQRSTWLAQQGSGASWWNLAHGRKAFRYSLLVRHMMNSTLLIILLVLLVLGGGGWGYSRRRR